MIKKDKKHTKINNPQPSLKPCFFKKISFFKTNTTSKKS